MAIPNVHIQKILFPTDLSTNARSAFSYALSLANLYEAQLVILHVLSDDGDIDEKLAGYVGAEQLQKIKDQQMEEARQVLIGKRKKSETIRRVLNHLCNNSPNPAGCSAAIKDEILIKTGEPVATIVKEVGTSGCDLIVMGSHGHNTMIDKMIGSTAEKVLRKSPVPVMMVRLPAADSEEEAEA